MKLNYRHSTLGLASALILTVTGCQTVPDTPAQARLPQTAHPAHRTQTDTLAQEWYLFSGLKIDKKYHQKLTPIRMDLRRLPHVSVYAGCNRLNFHWQPDDAPQRMHIRHTASTRMVCGNMLGDELMSTYLPKMVGYVFEKNDMLVLAAMDDSELVFLNRAALTRLGEAEKYIPKD